MTDIEPDANGPRYQQPDHGPGGKQPLADGGEAEGEPRKPDAGQKEAFDVERRQPFSRMSAI